MLIKALNRKRVSTIRQSDDEIFETPILGRQFLQSALHDEVSDAFQAILRAALQADLRITRFPAYYCITMNLRYPIQ